MGSFISSRANMNESLAKKVETEIVQHKVVIYSKTYCPYCVMAKDVFKEIKVEYHLVELDEHPEGSELQAILHKMTGARTVQMLLVSDAPVEYQKIFKDVTEKGERDCSLPLYFSSSAFSDSVPSEVYEPRFLYVMQEEYCIVSSKDSSIKCIGTSESTTCHMIILFFAETVLLAHTGIQDYNALELMVSRFLTDANATEASKVDLYLVGGYDDNSGVSFDLLNFLLHYFAKHKTRFNLKLICCGLFNSREQSFYHLPKVTGVLVDIDAKKVLRCQINKDQRGPVPILRHIWLYSSFGLKAIYNSKNGCVVLPMFKITLPAKFKLLEVIDDEYALSIFSTSPEAESDCFITELREMYGFVKDCIKKKIDPFKGKERLCFKTETDGKWIECDA